jgi:glycosyltransferase involved in cell wall biosynthesis
MGIGTASAVYVLPDKIGGVLSFVDNLLRHRRADGWLHHVVLTDNRLEQDTRSTHPLAADRQRRIEFSLPLDNVYSVLRRLARAIAPGPGVLVANDWLELATVSVHPTERTVVSITHGDFDYYYDLAERFEPFIDCFVTYTRRIRDRLADRLPRRHEAIVNLPYGVEIPPMCRRAARGPLRLLYVGRMARGKGVFDLPLIDARLRALGIEIAWTLQGAGPDALALQLSWGGGSPTRWTGVQPRERVLALYQEHDVLVMPSRAEGLPVALLEAMAAGVVPVVSDLESGIPEIVEAGGTGYRVRVADVDGFARAIAELDRDRDRLEVMSRAARRIVAERFDIRERAADYQALYARWRELRRPGRREAVIRHGSRLDRPWLPNAVVYAVRAARRRFCGSET